MGDDVLEVPRSRWATAQSWELEEWRRKDRLDRWWLDRLRQLLDRLRGRSGSGPGDDWNEWWAKELDRYSFLPEQIGSALEIGCGPYTNLRLIARDRQIERTVCSDPLAADYVRFQRGWLASAARAGSVEVNTQAAEDLTFSEEFDLVVMINVLDHVMSAPRALGAAVRSLRPRGFFVLGQDLSDETDCQLTRDDIGHPLKVSREWLGGQLEARFEIHLLKILPRHRGRNPAGHCGTYLFVGRARDTAPTAGDHSPRGQ